MPDTLMLSNLRTVGRVIYQLFISCLVGCLMSSIVAVVALILAVAFYGDFDKALRDLPKTRAFEFGILGYLGSLYGAAVGALLGGLGRLGTSAATFRTALYREVIPCGCVGAIVGLVGGLLVAAVFGRWVEAPWVAGASGGLAGILACVSVRWFRRSPQDPELMPTHGLKM